MKYRDARKLHNGDEVTRKKDRAILTVESIEVFWINKVVKINCYLSAERHCLFNDEVE